MYFYQPKRNVEPMNGVVLLGEKSDVMIPVAELGKEFYIEEVCVNRSSNQLCVENAVSYYEENIAKLEPETVLIHLGEAEAENFADHQEVFVRNYRALIQTIRKHNSRCRIGVISLENRGREKNLEVLNRTLRALADSEKCEFCDISTPILWNPNATKSAISFAQSMGLNTKIIKKPLRDMVKIFFGYRSLAEGETEKISDVRFAKALNKRLVTE